MNDQQIQQLGQAAARNMMRCAIGVTERASVRLSNAQIDRMVALLKAAGPATLDEALRDTREAFEAGMLMQAEATFHATFAAAGVRIGRQIIEEAQA